MGVGSEIASAVVHHRCDTPSRLELCPRAISVAVRPILVVATVLDDAEAFLSWHGQTVTRYVVSKRISSPVKHHQQNKKKLMSKEIESNTKPKQNKGIKKVLKQ